MDNKYIGYKLLQNGFKTWFLYMFKAIEGNKFIQEPIHTDLLQVFEEIYSLKKTRININIPPRAGKTTLATYFLIYAITKNPKSNFIYTSYSQSLLTDISRKISDILENPIYKALYSNNVRQEEETAEPINDYWREYLIQTEGKNQYSSKRIITSQGGVVLLTSIGSQITGFGVGSRTDKKFAGALIIDDANKPKETNSTKLRENVNTYFSNTLLSRLNNSNVPIINIQQRLHVEDLSGHLISKYGFYTLKKPLIENGNCTLPTQYTEERLKELQVDNYTFQSQYQQEPILDGGNIIKSEWFNYYDASKHYKYKQVFITADTAMKIKEHNDFSVFAVWGVNDIGHLHLIDLLRGKWEAPELIEQCLSLWQRIKINHRNLSALYCEDKASGIGLIQSLKKKYAIPVLPLKADTDKLCRVQAILTYIASGLVYLPNNKEQNKEFIAECEQFSRDDSHVHDDMVDCLSYAVQVGLVNQFTMFDFG